MSNLVNIVSPHQCSRLLCLPILLVLLFLRLLVMTFLGAESLTTKQKWPSAVVLQWTKSRFSKNKYTTQKRCELFSLDCSVMEFHCGGREVIADWHSSVAWETTRRWCFASCGWDGHALLALIHSLREKLSLLSLVSAAWLPSRQRRKEALRFIGFKKTLDIG